MQKPLPDYLDLFLSNRAALVDYAVPIVGCRSRAEDVVQEAYIRFTAAADGKSRRVQLVHPLGYLRRVVRNLALDLVRSPAYLSGGHDAKTLEQMSVESRTPEETALYRDEIRALAEALEELPERTRTAFLMHRVEGCTLQEVASRLGVSVVRAHQLVQDALLHAADSLDERIGRV